MADTLALEQGFELFPGMAREQFESLLKGQGVGHQTLNIGTSIGGRAAANEVMREGTADAVLGEFAMAKQVQVIEQALERIASRGAVAYGRDAIEAAVEQGAVESLVIEAGLLRSDDFWARAAMQIREANGEIIQASQDHDAGEQLVSMGGALALLRWTMD
jgi:protein pelota